MVSKTRESDRKNRILIMENMAVCMRMYARTGERDWLDKAQLLGMTARQLNERIKTHDYTKEDEDERIVADLDRQAKEMGV